jgi:hypothetical protein
MPAYPFRTERTSSGSGQNPKLPDGSCPCPRGATTRRQYCDENDKLVMEKEVYRVTLCQPIPNTDLCRIKDTTTTTTVYTGDPCPDDLGTARFDDEAFDRYVEELPVYEEPDGAASDREQKGPDQSV